MGINGLSLKIHVYEWTMKALICSTVQLLLKSDSTALNTVFFPLHEWGHDLIAVCVVVACLNALHPNKSYLFRQMLPEAKQHLITLFLTNTPFAETYINHNIKRSF